MRHILVAIDESPEGRGALTGAARLASRAAARLTALKIVPPDSPLLAGPGALERLQRDHAALISLLSPPIPPVEFVVAIGLPGIEISRFAESSGADLVVLGRKRRSSVERLRVGSTADAVARRSQVPCIFVGPGDSSFDRLLVALDGTERGMLVLNWARRFAKVVGARLQVITVDPVCDDPRGSHGTHNGKIRRLAEAIETLRREEIIARETSPTFIAEPAPALLIQRGRVIDEVVKTTLHTQSDLLVVGHHRGGPASTNGESGGTRFLLRLSPANLLTVPL